MNRFLIEQQLRSFLHEDLGHGDLTTDAIFSKNQIGKGVFVAKEALVTVGMERVAGLVFQLLNPGVEITHTKPDGYLAGAGDVLFEITGPVNSLLHGERVALNLVQRLCGIATLTASFIKQVKDLPAAITDTRKTTPGLRIFEKYAVRVGGGANHRFNLCDGVLIKDNHIAACGSISEAVRLTHENAPHTIRIEVEAETMEQVQECIDCHGVDIIMLDNMSLDSMRSAVEYIDGRALVEASGGVTLETVRGIAQTGVDLISVGALTHSAPASDISMDWH